MSSGTTTRLTLDELFPVPSPPPSQLCPQRFPGANSESLAALQSVLKDNHQRYHIFTNDKGFHNHTMHRALVTYALGGSAATIRYYYEHEDLILPAFESPEPITEDNFIDHLGDENFYQAYVAFFSEQIFEKGAVHTLERFVFSEEYNFQEGRDVGTQPEMLGRFFSNLLHPLIHVGYGAEFGLKGMVVEGLALTSVHKLQIWKLFSFSHSPLSSIIGADDVSNHLSSLALDTPAASGTPTVSKTGNIHAFDIAAQILKDDRLKDKATSDVIGRPPEILFGHVAIVSEHVGKWATDLNEPGEIERKMEEVIWLSSLVYAVGGLKPNGFRCDFFLAHLVTSSIFLPSVIVYLSPRSSALLLRAYLVVALSWWVLCGRPALDIKSFMTATSVEPSVPTTPAPKTPPTIKTTPTPNPFLPLLQSTIPHPDDHLVKIQRAFAHFDTLYGTRPAGCFKGTELEGAELLDGSLFLRAALLTADGIGWVREGQEMRPFSIGEF